MNKITLLFIAIVTLFGTPASANPDITDLLKGAAASLSGGKGSDDTNNGVLSGLQGLVEGLISGRQLQIFCSRRCFPERQFIKESRRFRSCRCHHSQNSSILRKSWNHQPHSYIQRRQDLPVYNQKGQVERNIRERSRL